ncbi:MAG: 7-cyano-7-deazaguanine synthase QueC [Candidatus Marinimicrobia bacterium]|nr:7-cyano-7-deazaguanine synthase QueC [Candidatus Neomarinimicrobiota bacterium]|tara:strand:+ start:722 stop:1381 length:660 start_codon:yes stop_codon:yes gene_type:complete
MIRAVILVSGGMDSCVTAAMAKNDGFELCFLHLNYGQRTENRELKAFHDIADFYDVKNRLIVDMTHLAQIGGSCLTDSTIDVPNADLENEEIPISYVPFRNANILSAATSWAEVLGANSLFIGAVEEDSSGYPDCRRRFYDAFEKTIDEGTKPDTHIKIITPLIELSKKEIILEGNALHAPINLSWSCYEREDIPCGKCDSCALRARGFNQAGLLDPIL